MTRPRHNSALKMLRVGALALTLAAVPLLGILPTAPAQAAGRVSVTSSLGTARASAEGATTINVSGAGFQSIAKAFGGVYVVFGHAPDAASWRPSQGGKSGQDFFYIADSQAKENSGYQRFIAFPGSSTADSANGGTLSDSGDFTLSMVIPGPTLRVDAPGGSKDIDCRQVQCGVFTFGAHGVSNANNETFTPISFADGGTTTGAQGTAPAAGAAAGAANATPAEGGTTAPKAIADGQPRLGIEQKTVVAGRALGFTAAGFAPGEQVVATVASGIAAAGPLTAGSYGEIAGVVQIPLDMIPGTHKIKLQAAGTGTTAEAEFSVMANAAAIPAAQTGNESGVWWALVAVLVLGSLLLLLLLTSLVTTVLRRRRTGPPRTQPVTKLSATPKGQS